MARSSRCRPPAKRRQAEPVEVQATEEKPLRPGQCREHMRKTLALEFREIVKGFVEEAKRGSCQHVKLATEFLEKPARRRRSTGGSAARILREVRQATGWEETAAK